VLAALAAWGRLPDLALVLCLGATGFLTGVITPSRDMLVRAAAPPGAEGRAFGIVSTGFNIGGAVGPMLFGWLLDRGHFSGIFWAAVVFMVLTVMLTLLQEHRAARAPRPLSRPAAT
jgi:MFS family permease